MYTAEATDNDDSGVQEDSGMGCEGVNGGQQWWWACKLAIEHFVETSWDGVMRRDHVRARHSDANFTSCLCMCSKFLELKAGA